MAAGGEEEEEGGAVGPIVPPPPAEGPELLAVREELAQRLSGTVLYLQADGSLVEGAGLSTEEQRRLLEQLLAVAESPRPGTAEPPPPRHAATPLAPAELQRVIEQVSKAQEQQKPPPAAAQLEPGPGPPPCRGGGCPPPRDAVLLPPQARGAAPPLASIMQNAAQQLQSVAQQVALQQGKSMAAARLLPQKVSEAGAGEGGKEGACGARLAVIHRRGQVSGGGVLVFFLLFPFLIFLFSHTCPWV